MKRRIICVLFILLFMLNNTAYATNWIYFGSAQGLSPNCMYYDVESVVIDGDSLFFWCFIELNDPPDEGGMAKMVYCEEALLVAPRRTRLLEIRAYDSENNELWVWRPQKPNYKEVEPGSEDDDLINAVLPYAQPK